MARGTGPSQGQSPDDRGPHRFATTRWSIVAAAGRRDTPGREALAALCEAYWYPVYAYVRRRGYGAEDAQDLTQSFFTRLLETDSLQAADRTRGRFRSFLLASTEHFLANARRHAAAAKRGGGRAPISLDFQAGERRYSLEPAHELTPDKLFERKWALALMGQALAKLREEFARAGKLEVFEQLKGLFGGAEAKVPYREVAAALGMSEGAVKVAVHRLRRRYRELLREEVAQTVERPEDVEEELRELFAALGGGS